MERKQFLFLITKLVIAFKEDFGPEREELYFEFLGNLKPERLVAAIGEAIATKQWFPRISELLDLVEGPKLSKDAEYLSYLDRKNREFAETMRPKQIEYATKEEAKAFLDLISDKLRQDEGKRAQERARRFEDRRQQLKKQAEELLS